VRGGGEVRFEKIHNCGRFNRTAHRFGGRGKDGARTKREKISKVTKTCLGESENVVTTTQGV